MIEIRNKRTIEFTCENLLQMKIAQDVAIYLFKTF